MTFPFEALSGDHRQLGMLVAVAIGFAFGFVLERVGFGQAPKLVGQFHGTDMTVLKVIFSAIVTAMLGTIVLSGLHVLDLTVVVARYPTFLWPMVVGGFFLGVGFVISGYCPGTSVVAMASGKLDGLLTVAGIAIGSVAYSELQAAVPALGRFHDASNLGVLSLAQLLHLPPAVVGVLVAVVAMAAFLGAERIELALSGKEPPGGRPRRIVFASFALLAFAGIATLLLPAPTTAQTCVRGEATQPALECRRDAGR
jgi:uncharacterized membrane protein YedE/YeeE